MRIYQLLRLSLTLTIILSTVISAAINPKNAIGIWLFEGDAKDISGKKNHGELMNGAGFTDKAKFNNKALSLDGKDDHVVVKSSKSLDEPVQNYTGVAWIKIKKKMLYVAGKVSVDVAASGTFGLKGKDLWIGAQSPNRRPTSGLIDDVGVFNKALSAANINTILKDGLGSILATTAVSPKDRLTTTWSHIKSQ